MADGSVSPSSVSWTAVSDGSFVGANNHAQRRGAVKLKRSTCALEDTIVKRGRANAGVWVRAPVMLVTPAKASRRHCAGNISTCASLLCFTMTQPATAQETRLPQQHLLLCQPTSTYFNQCSVFPPANS